MNATLNAIRAYEPCADGWRKLLAGLGKTEADDEPLALTLILDINGLDDALWALRCVDDQAQVRRYAVWCARQVQHLMTDPRSLAALDVAERYAEGQATRDELAAARDAARDAWGASRDAAAAAADAAWAATRDAVWAAAAAADAACAAALDAADAACAAARDAAKDARDAARQAQKAQFRAMFGGDK